MLAITDTHNLLAVETLIGGSSGIPDEISFVTNRPHEMCSDGKRRPTSMRAENICLIWLGELQHFISSDR
jgi:hypothetical protein